MEISRYRHCADEKLRIMYHAFKIKKGIGKMYIRNAALSDFEKASELYDKVTLHLENNINYPDWIHKVYPSSETVEKGIKEGSLFVCEEGGKTIGAFLLNTDPDGDYSQGNWTADIAEGEYMIIHALAVDPDYKGRGIGKRMVKFCLDYAKGKGHRAIRLDAVPKNTPARGMYESMGFRFAGERDLKRQETGIPSFALYEYNF